MWHVEIIPIIVNGGHLGGFDIVCVDNESLLILIVEKMKSLNAT